MKMHYGSQLVSFEPTQIWASLEIGTLKVKVEGTAESGLTPKEMEEYLSHPGRRMEISNPSNYVVLAIPPGRANPISVKAEPGAEAGTLAITFEVEGNLS